MPRRVQCKTARQIFQVWNVQVHGDGRHVADTADYMLVLCSFTIQLVVLRLK